MKTKKIAVIGCGNMAYSLVTGYFKNRKDDEFKFYCYTPSKTKAIKLASEVGGEFTDDLSKLSDCDYYLLGMKPFQLKEFAENFRDKINKKAVIVSMLTGTPVKTLKELFFNMPVIRFMPNTPSKVGEGINLVYCNSQITEPHLYFINKFLTLNTKPYFLKNELLIDQLAGIVGSGPAYIFEVARIFSEEIGKLVDQDLADMMASDLFFGSAVLMKNKGNKNFSELRDEVTSKKGITFEGLKSLNEHKISDIFSQAFASAYQRNLEIIAENSSAPK